MKRPHRKIPSHFAIALSSLPKDENDYRSAWGETKPAFMPGTSWQPWVITIQVLDAVGKGISGVVATLMVADFTKGSGRFNLEQGVIATAIGLRAAGNYSTGLVVDKWGYNAVFLMFPAIACGALFVFVALVPEPAEPEAQTRLRPA
ncbi:hypothetical protein [Planctomicrobium sp. SH527]|uniref:hypothetical protein n=1 Tax=Planctomicrobium sp. SH527 TaxID=3448123 RepID=UPI003F5C2953